MMTPTLSAGAGALRRAFRGARRWSASIALLAFQVTPVSVQQTAEGRFDVGIGFTGDKYLQEAFSCDGAKLGERPVTSMVVSAVFDYMATDGIRISGFAGSSSAGTEAVNCTAREDSFCSFPAPFEGGFAGALIAHEGRKMGLGVGLVTKPFNEEDDGLTYTAPKSTQVIRPAIHARFGNREKAYFRLDINGVRTPGQVPMHSLGVGFGKAGYHSERGFVGFGFLPYPGVGDGIASVITGNVAIPVKQFGDVLMGGYAGAGQSVGFTVGARLHMRGGK